MFRMTETLGQAKATAMKMPRDPAWKKAVGARIVEGREALGRTQANVAKALGISPQRLSNYETGSRPLDIELASKLCDNFGLTLDYLYRGQLYGLPRELADRIGSLRVPDGTLRN